MGSVFISYRRDDSQALVERIYPAIKAQLPNQTVFRDIEGIRPGTNFPELLREKLADASVILVVIGPRWLEVLKHRKTEPVDYVREEVRFALESPQAVVIPVTIGGARVPSEADLADFPDLRALAHCSGTPVRLDRDFDHDIGYLVKVLADPITSESVGAILAGRYKLLHQVGEGGMGTVFAAQQTHPIRRHVAVKLIKLGMDTKDVLARFDAEKQALAVMDHPNIARVLDADMTPLGRPFFVMELVQGKPITEYCDARKLSLRNRLELFKAVCQAVQHAHQKGIIHRDIKPSNVLVEEIGGQSVLKVIDFGLAKAMGPKLTEKSLLSESGKLLGTPGYMSPEQAEGKPLNIDTRSDIYSLGVLLYELLAGNPPFTRKELEEAGEDEMKRVIREEEPPIPSARLSSSDALPSIAANRGLEPTRLTKLLRSELDWIAMKAIDKDRTRRYQSALALAEEVERYLADEVVQARPPSVGYRSRKFLRRHRRPVVLGLVALISVVGGLTVGLIREAKQRQIAEENEGAALTAKGEAEAATTRAEEAQQREADQRQIAEQKKNEAVAAKLKADAAADAAQKAQESEAAQLVIAINQKKLADKANKRARDALDAMTSTITGDSLATQKAISPEQKKFLTDVLKYYKDFAGEKGDDELSRKRIAESAFRVGLIEYRLGRKEGSPAAFRLALNGFESMTADFPAVAEYRANLASTHNNLGLLLKDLGQWAEVEAHYRKALAIQEKLKADFPTVSEYPSSLGMSHRNLGVLFQGIGKWVEAEEQYREALAIQEKLAANFPTVPEHRADQAVSHHNLGFLLMGIGKRVEADGQYRKALAIQEKLKADFPTISEYRSSLARSHNNLGILLMSIGKRVEAEEQYRKALAIWEKLVTEFPAVPEYRSSLAMSLGDLGILISDLGKPVEAEEQSRKAVVIFEMLAADFPTVPEYRLKLAKSHHNLGGLLDDLGKHVEAEEQYRKALAIREKLVTDFPTVPEYNSDLASSHNNLGLLLTGIEKQVEAEAQYRKALAIREKLVTEFPAVPEYRSDLASSHNSLGLLLASLRKWSNAEEQCRKALAIREKLVAEFPAGPEYRVDLAGTHNILGLLLASLQKWTEAEEQMHKFLTVQEKLAADFPAIPKYRQKVIGGLYNFACFCAIASGNVVGKKQEYADRAMELLRKAVEAGYKNAEELAKDTKLDPLRDRADFQALLESLSPAKPKKK